MAVDTLSLILLIVGIVALLWGIFAASKNKTAVSLIGLVVLVFGLLGAFGAIDFGRITQQPQAQVFTGVSPPVQSGVSSQCSANAITSNGKSQADILYRNVENSTGIGYLTGTVSANVNGAFIDSATTNAGGSGTSYVSMSNIPNCGKGELVGTVTTGTGFASSRKVFDIEKGQLVAGYDFSNQAVHKYEVRGASADVVSIVCYDSALNPASNGQINGSVDTSLAIGAASAESAEKISGTGTADGTAYFKNTSLGSKGSINFYCDLEVNGTSSVFGAYDEPDAVVISYDTGTAAKFSSNSLNLVGDQAISLNKLGTCPSDIKDNRNVEACWTANNLKPGVLYRIRGTLVGDNGDVVASDTAPSIYIDDKVFFRDTDSNIKYQSFSSSGGTNQGVGGTKLQFVLS